MALFKSSSRTLSLSESRGATRPAGSRSTPPTIDKHLLDYIRVLVKRRWLGLGVLGVVMALAALHVYTATPIYESDVQILIEHENANTFSLKDSVEQDRETTDYYHTQYTILQSRSVARRAIDALGAWNNPELVGGDVLQTGLVDGVMNWVTGTVARLRGAKPAKPATGHNPAPTTTAATGTETPAQTSATDAFISRLTVVPVQTSRLVDVKFKGGDRKFAASAVNALAQAYIDQNLEQRMSASKETTDWLTQQLAEQKHRIDVSEAALQSYRESHNAVSLADQQAISAQKLADLNSMVTRAKADRISRQALYGQVRDLQTRDLAIDTLPSVLSNGYLQQLKADISKFQQQYLQLSLTLGDNNPTMIGLKTSISDAEGKLKVELANQVERIKNEYEAADSLEKNLTQALESQKREATEMSRTGMDYSVLERDVSLNRQIFETLLARTREKGIAGELKSSDVRIVDVAQVPQSPIWPRTNEMLMYAAFFGSLISVGLVFFVEYMDDRIKTPEEIKQYLGLPFLGMVPLIEREDLKDPLFTEALRQIRTNVIFSADQRAHSLVVTSTGPGEGKTVVSCNLAKGLAMARRDVLLIDVDMRRPRVHEVFGIEQQPGLSDLLSDSVDLSNAMRETAVKGLWVMPAGSPTQTPAELLSSPEFGKLLATLPERFEWVILDSPPVAAVADSCIVANRASAVLFVVGSQQTKRSAALNALEQLDTAGATFLGAVLNRVQLRRDAFYYSAYYRPAYEKYYTPATAPSAPEAGDKAQKAEKARDKTDDQDAAANG